jgi:hypothetical protein
MQLQFASELSIALSTERMAAYQQRIASGSKLDLYSHYGWNMALCESLYSPLQMLEVSFRNNIHNAAKQHYGQDNWYDISGIIQPRDYRPIQDAKDGLTRRSRPLTADNVISELSFGFWTRLLDVRYERILWPAIIRTSFPNMRRRERTRQNLSRRFNQIRLLRNRIFHHEPVWYWQNLEQQHLDILDALGWLQPSARDLTLSIDKFPIVYASGLEEVKTNLASFC